MKEIEKANLEILILNKSSKRDFSTPLMYLQAVVIIKTLI